MDETAMDNESSSPVPTSTDDNNSDEIWEIIDKEDDGNTCFVFESMAVF